GLNPQLDVTDSPLILRFQGSPCPCELARKTLIGERCRGWGISCKSLSGKKKISHSITPRGLSGQPQRGGDGAPGKDCPVSCYMPQAQLLAGAEEPHVVLAHHIPAAHHGEADALPAGTRRGPGKHRRIIQL